MKLWILMISLMTAVLIAGCTGTKEAADKTSGANDEATPATKKSDDGYVASESGTAKATPESGKANVQGKVFFNEKPVEGVEVKLCETFSTFSGCGGETFTSKTDANGEYLIANVAPRDYQGLIVRVFDTKSYVFASNRFGISASKYKIEPDTTFFAPSTNLFKSDLKVTSPKPKSKVDAKTLEISWEPYEGAAYYKLGMYAQETSSESPYVNEKIEGTSLKADKPIKNGEYRIKIDAFNANDIKLAELSEDLEFTVTGGEASTAGNSGN